MEVVLHSDLDIDLIQRLAIAVAIGLIIGIERGWGSRELAEGERALGLRTHMLASLLGGVWAALARGQGDGGLVMLGIAFLVFAAASIVFRLREIQHHGTFGATTVVASMMAFALGALAVLGNSIAASAAGVATAIILALKPALHDWVKRLTWEELRAGLLLLAMTVILLPILPDRELGPLGAFNPHELWLMTVLIAVVSFAGYVAVKLAGEQRGVLLFGLAGGLVSSTAVTLSMARLALENADKLNLFVSGALLANLAMMVRVAVIATLFNLQLFAWLVLPLALAAISQAAVVWFLLRRQISEGGSHGSGMLKNPFELPVVLSFGALLTVVMFLGKLAMIWAGAKGVLVLAAVSGVADVDAITLLMARLARSEVSASIASQAIVLAIAVNTVAKAVLAWITGGRGAGRLVFVGAIAALTSGLAGLLLTRLTGFSAWLR